MRLSSLFISIILLAGFTATFPNIGLADEARTTAMKLGDAAFQKRADPKQAMLALETYRKLYSANPDDPEAGWRLAMACYFVGHRMTKGKEEQKKIFDEGKLAGERSIKNSENCAPCYFWHAINYALYGKAKGVMSTLFALDDVQKGLRKSIELDPKYVGAGAYRLLGQIEENLPGLLGGSNSRAREYYNQAIAADPDEPLNYLFLARLLKKKFKEREEAVKIAQRGLQVPKPSADRLESIDALDALKEFLKKK